MRDIMAFDLNKIPAVEGEEMDDVEEVSTTNTGTQDHGLLRVGPWQTLSPTQLASLYNMVQVPATFHRVHHVITHRANGTSEHAWISWLPAFPGGGSHSSTVLHASEWRTMPSIFHALSTTSLRPDHHHQVVTSAFSDPRTVWDIGSSSQGAGNNIVEGKEEETRNLAFLADFDYSTERCSPTVPCSRCLQFCKAPLPVNLAAATSVGTVYVDDACPPVLKNMDEQESAQRKGARHGPKSRSSPFRGVTYYKRTGRWESHIWHEAAQVYLGASETKEEAARSYDKAAIMLGGPDADINFEPESYQHEMNYLYKLSKEQLVIYLRRDSRGFGAQAAYPGVKHVKNHYQATFGISLLGTFPTEEEAARVVYKAAVQKSCGTIARLIIDTHHVRNMPSFAAQRHAAVYPEEAEAMMLKTKTKASKTGGRSSPSTRQKPSSESSPVTPSETASPDPVEQFPAIQINENESPGAKRNRSTWEQYLASTRAHKQTCPTKDAAARDPPATSIVPPASSSRPGSCNTTSPGVGVSRIPLSSATDLSAFSAIGHTSTPSSVAGCSDSSPSWKKRPTASGTSSAPPGPIKFKLFNVEINVAEEKAAPEDGGHGT